MAYVNVPKDLTKVKTKVLFNLTKRQLKRAAPFAEFPANTGNPSEKS